uniref:Upstream of FLC1 protein isoform X1 n=1 Tax=Cymbidium ensifolium TaxID=78740 RepID=A0A5B9MNY5_CYMEN|nr:upstream of FLC1 protein isoform X1 [Cymbidium ensifolium]QEG03061.1 upstream of FLC1 protein isoform X4 [Cymbidium ensifolium]QEG03062.1 upstream of FLC1 protein isoform X5 [Cymbidium ensifolium]
MEGRARRHGAQVSPERSKVWTEPSPKHQLQRQQGVKVPVVYYLCKNRHLEHPHFIEVSVSSPGGLYLKDVINRLVVLRGKRMPKMYSWSCKRSYKNGYVWQDLSEDDLILPTHGNEYILKGSELLDQTPPDRLQDTSSNSRLQKSVALQQDQSTCSRVLEASSSYSSPVSTVREGKSPSPPPHTTPPLQEDDNPIPLHQSSSPERGFSNFSECRIFMLSGAQDASTQTEDRGERRELETTTHSASASTGDGLASVIQQNLDTPSHDAIKKDISPSRTPSSASSGTKVDTLESLIRAEVNKVNSFRIIEEEEVIPMKVKMKRTNALLQLLTCGSTLVKDHHSLGFIQTYKPRFLSMRLGPTFPSAMTLREFDYMTGGSRVMRLGTERRTSFSRNLAENCVTYKEDGVEASPSCTAFYNGGMTYRSPDLKGNKEKVADLVGSNSPPIQNLSSKPMLNGTFRSPILDARSSLAQQSHDKSPSTSSLSASKMIADVTASKGSPIMAESIQQETERTIKIEES